MFRWRISIFGKTPARPLGVVRAPDEETARQRAIEFFQIEPALAVQGGGGEGHGGEEGQGEVLTRLSQMHA